MNDAPHYDGACRLNHDDRVLFLTTDQTVKYITAGRPTLGAGAKDGRSS